MSDLGCSTRNTSVNFDPSNLENFQAPSVDPLPRSDMNLCELSQSQFALATAARELASMHRTNHGTAHCCYGALQLESYLLPMSEVLSIGTSSQASLNLLKSSIVFLHGVNRSCKSNSLVIGFPAPKGSPHTCKLR